MTTPMSIRKLRQKVIAVDKREDKNWATSLSERKLKEVSFHNKKHTELELAKENKAVDTYEAVYSNRKYYKAVKSTSEYLDQWIAEEAGGKVFLDYCCGIGGNSIKAALAGASLVIGIDVSERSLAVAQQRAKDAGVSEVCLFILGDAESTQLPKSCIDRGICSGVLHHLDIHQAIPELNRITKPGGKFLALEALDYNPFIKLYRYLTPGLRTDWEKAHILSLKDVKHIEKYFSVSQIKFWHILSILIPHTPKILQSVLPIVDNFLVKIPGIRLMSWMFTFEFTRAEDK